MTKYKISFHCGQVSSYLVEEHESKSEALEVWRKKIIGARTIEDFLAVGDVLINPKHVCFVVVEELVVEAEAPTEAATIEV